MCFSRQEDSVLSTAFRFERVFETFRLPREKSIALVYATTEDIERQEVADASEMIEAYGTIVNLVDMDDATQQLEALAV